MKVSFSATRRLMLTCSGIISLIIASSLIAATSSDNSAQPAIADLLANDHLDDYYSNVVLGYRIITETELYATRYVGNQLRCRNCHLDAGRTPDAIPLNVAGMFPKWRAKNGLKNGIELRIRECFLYSLDGLMPPENAPEVMAVAAYMHYLSQGQVIGKPPPGMGVPTLPNTGQDPNPVTGKAVYDAKCAACHGIDGAGDATHSYPPLWGSGSYNSGAGMRNIDKAAGFIWANMPFGSGRTLTPQEAKDVAAYINDQVRPIDPRQGKLRLAVDAIYLWLSNLW